MTTDFRSRNKKSKTYPTLYYPLPPCVHFLLNPIQILMCWQVFKLGDSMLQSTTNVTVWSGIQTWLFRGDRHLTYLTTASLFFFTVYPVTAPLLTPHIQFPLKKVRAPVRVNSLASRLLLTCVQTFTRELIQKNLLSNFEYMKFMSAKYMKLKYHCRLETTDLMTCEKSQPAVAEKWLSDFQLTANWFHSAQINTNLVDRIKPLDFIYGL